MGKQGTESRKIVLDILSEYKSGNGKFNEVLKSALDKADYMEKTDKAFISRLARGCVEKEYTLCYVISMYAHTGNKKIKPVIKLILEMAVYQILFMDGVKDYAACSEAVNLVKKRGLSGLTPFVNGVLRNIVREKENIVWPDKEKDRKQYLSVMYSFPEWLIDYFDEIYGRDECERILEGTEKKGNLTVRLNEKLPSDKQKEIIGRIEETGIEINEHPYSRYAFILDNIDSIGRVPGFAEGYITVQDITSQLAVAVAGIKEGDTVLDCCAAPGGKTMHAALLAGESGKVFSRDVSDYKLELIRENANRLGLNNIEYEIRDARETDEKLIGKCDVVICDAPCSGLGIIGRKPDIKYNVTPDTIRELALLQRQIIDTAVKYLKKGGIFIYSTCTVTREENLDNRQYIIDEKGLKPMPFISNLNEKLVSNSNKADLEAGFIRFLPGHDAADGFFISRYTNE